MAKRKGPKIIFSDIKTFQELDNLQRIIEIRYGGKMPIEIYREFFSRISNPAMKLNFVNRFCSRTYSRMQDSSTN